jgi:hypothetical protein
LSHVAILRSPRLTNPRFSVSKSCFPEDMATGGM